MTTAEFISELFYRVDDAMKAVRKHPQASRWPREVGTLGLLFALKGVSHRAFSRWLSRNGRPLLPSRPERTRLFRLFKPPHAWTAAFLAVPTLLGVVDAYGLALIHPIREGRLPAQIGKKGLSNHRWIVGGRLCLLRPIDRDQRCSMLNYPGVSTVVLMPWQGE